MRQTEQTAIVVRHVNYRENDRMLTLFSPTQGRVEAVARGCRRPKSPLVAASELFALGDYELYEKNGRRTVTGAVLTETFYPLRGDWARLTCGMYALECCEAAIQPEHADQDLFLLLLHTLSRLSFSDQPWAPLMSGFLLYFAETEGLRPRVNHCVRCGRRVEEVPAGFDLEEGGLLCPACRRPGERNLRPLSRENLRWLRRRGPASSWVNTEDAIAPLGVLRAYVEPRLDRQLKTAPLMDALGREEAEPAT